MNWTEVLELTASNLSSSQSRVVLVVAKLYVSEVVDGRYHEWNCN